MDEQLDTLMRLLASYRFAFTSEDELQQGIANVLTGGGFEFRREVHLSRWDRPDFLVGLIVIEVKIDSSRANLIRQLHRYAGFDEVGTLIVVTDRSRLADLPATLNGKSLDVVLLRTL